jgi:hypothetical protein
VRRNTEPRHEILTRICTIIEKEGYPAILRGLRKATQLDESGRYQGRIVHGLINLFLRLLGQLHVIFMKWSEETIEREKQAESQKAKNGGKRGQILTMMNGTNAESKDLPKGLSGAISDLTCLMIVSIDALKPESSLLLEGYLCCLLDYIGKTLCFIVFGQEEIRADSFMPIKNGEEAQLAGTVKNRALRMEGPYLTRILEQSLRFAAANQHLIASRQTDESVGHGKMGFLESIIGKLQNTLLKGIFGSDDLFADSLTRQKGAETDLGDKIETLVDERGDRLVSGVWDLVGWPVLERAIESPQEAGTADGGAA